MAEPPEFLIEKFRFPISFRSGPIGTALIGKQDVILDAGKGSRYLRSAFMLLVGAPSSGVLPLILDGIVAGCLYFDGASESFTLDKNPAGVARITQLRRPRHFPPETLRGLALRRRRIVRRPRRHPKSEIRNPLLQW